MKSIRLPLLSLATWLALCAVPAQAQNQTKNSNSRDIKVQMTAAAWQFKPNTAEFLTHKGVPAVKLTSQERITIAGVTFSEGTIEYDVEPLSEVFAGIHFRMADDKESEYVYLRLARAGHPTAMDAIQYAPYLKGVLLWDLLEWFQGPATIKKGDWNHVKIVVSGAQMLVYLNDMTSAVLQVPQLEGNTTQGSIAFEGPGIVANVTIRPGAVGDLPPTPGFDPTHRDPRYIRMWQVTQPQPLPAGRELFEGDFPKPSTEWLPVKAERRGLINLSRMFVSGQSRQSVWLRTKINATTARKSTLALGFSDDVWVFVNGLPVFVDKNRYRSAAMRKKPDGRISTENAKIEIPLNAGDNELLVGLANDFYGWALIAQLDDMEGLTVSTDFPKPVMPPSDLSPYTGVYKTTTDFPNLIFTQEAGELKVQTPGETAVTLEYFDADKFRFVPAGIVIEFRRGDNQVMLRQGGKEYLFNKQ